jgi:molybdopterin synthase sulfur carrier subunit
MVVHILYFASLRERLGVERESLELLPGVNDLDALLAQLRDRGGVWADVFSGDAPVLMAINQEMARTGDTLSDGDEVGLFPPVTGG